MVRAEEIVRYAHAFLPSELGKAVGPGAVAEAARRKAKSPDVLYQKSKITEANSTFKTAYMHQNSFLEPTNSSKPIAKNAHYAEQLQAALEAER